MSTPSIAPVVLFLGPEEAEKEAAIGELLQAARTAFGDVEEHRFYAFETSIESVVSILRNGSLFGSFTAVRLRAVDQLKGKGPLQVLSDYLAHPHQQAILILESNETTVERGLESIVGAKHKRVFWEMFDNQKQGWLRAYCTRRGARIDDEAIELLLELVENTTADLKVACDRLIAFVGKQISAADVERTVYHAKEESVFTLFEAVLERDLARALEITAQLLVADDAMPIVLGLQWQLDQFTRYQLARAAGTADAEIFRVLRVNSKRAQARLQKAARAFRPDECCAMYAACVHTDAALRAYGTAMHAGLVQLLLYSLIARGGAFRVQVAAR